MTQIVGVRGGAVGAITTAESTIDCTALAGCEVMIGSDDQDIWFCFATATDAATLVTTATTAASATALVADRVAAGTKVRRSVSARSPILVVKTVTGTGTVRVKRVSHLDTSL